MKPTASLFPRQTGMALLAILAALILVGGYGVYRLANLSSGGEPVRQNTLTSLARAKEALITYAVLDASRPGRLPCPSTTDDGNTPLFTLNDCPSYGGWIPWKTLGLADHADAGGQNFRYYVSPSFGGNHTTVALNSNTDATLRLNVPSGTASNDIVAVLIATQGPEDDRNADGDDYFYSGSNASPNDNDQVLGITRQELMAAVEQRIANQLRMCLEQHANDPANLEKTYPWPASLISTNYAGGTGSLFGMVPDTQAANPEATLKAVIAKLTATSSAISSTSNSSDQLSLARQLQAQTAIAMPLFDRVFINAADLDASAKLATQAFTSLDNTLVAITVSKTVYQRDSGSLPDAINVALPSLSALITSLENAGFDLFISELKVQATKLKAKLDAATTLPSSANFDALITPINLFKNSLLEYSYSPNPDINAALTSAYNASITAAASVNEARKSPSAPFTTQALNDTNSLYLLLQTLDSVIQGRRVNLDPQELSFRSNQLLATLAISETQQATLLLQLRSATSLVSTLSTSGSQFTSLQQATLAALSSAEQAAQNSPELISSTTSIASNQLSALANALNANGDNIALEALRISRNALTSASSTIPANVTGGRALREPVKTVLYWSQLASSQAADIARLARKGISSTSDSDTSAYTAAKRLLDSLDGSNGTLPLLDRAVQAPSAEATQNAQSALADSMALLTTLLNNANNLNGVLNTGMAVAGAPTPWFGTACSFLTPTASSGNWWSNNNWKSLIFYQISDRVRPLTGTLKVNGNGTYRVVTLSAGRALAPAQNRAIRSASNYLEKINGDVSRDGAAKSPSPQFISEPVSPAFNDRIAY